MGMGTYIDIDTIPMESTNSPHGVPSGLWSTYTVVLNPSDPLIKYSHFDL